MRYCAQCHNAFADDIEVCPNDGSPLADFDVNKLIGQTIDSKYQVVALLGLGGMGAVFRARHSFINNDVAIKIIHPRLAMNNEVAERFLREARAAAMIDHPNAIRVTDFGRAGELLYLVMEFIQGYSLSNLIRKKGYLAPATTASIMSQVCAALDAAHTHHIIHRDLKPDNIMIKQNDLGQQVIKVLDFGIAKMKTADNNSASITRAGTIVGTLNYMSPEQCRGDEVIDLRSDIYSLGVVAFEMLTGRLPFSAPTPTGLAVKHIIEPPPGLRSIVPDIPERVEKVVLRALEKEPTARYRRAGEFAAELINSVHGGGDSNRTQVLVGSGMPGDPVKGVTRPLYELGGNLEQDLPPQAGPPTAGYTEANTGMVQRATMTSATKVQTDEQPATKIKTDEQSAPALPPIPQPRRRAPLYAAVAAAVVIIAASVGYFLIPREAGKVPASPGSQTPSNEFPGMVLIQSGWLKMGSLEGFDYEQPVHDVWVDPFYLDTNEVTNAEFEKFVNETGYRTDAEKAGDELNWRAYATAERSNHPVVQISWNDATTYAKWAGKRLPTEAEWEYAARGGQISKKYPWGDEPPQRRANFGQGGQTFEAPNIPTQPIRSYEANGYGLYDMVGNVWEWCEDWYDVNYYRNSPERNPRGPANGKSRVIRGGSWFTDYTKIRVSTRISEIPDGYEYDRGFRCAKSK
ncbi:MAG: bifunctional serine/threonine-protein kinase/formylglycine-generating enzyme family protein [Acidobacteriota bacterium]